MTSILAEKLPLKDPQLTPADFACKKPALVGDTDDTALYAAVGAALSQWALVEESLSDLFASLLQTNVPAAHFAMGAMISASARVDVINAAAEVALRQDPALLKQWKKGWFEILRSASGRRNEIAHGYVLRFTESDGSTHSLLVPSFFNAKKWSEDKSTPKFQYNAEMIIDLANKYGRLWKQIKNYAVDVRAYNVALRQKRSQQGPRQPPKSSPRSLDPE